MQSRRQGLQIFSFDFLQNYDILVCTIFGFGVVFDFGLNCLWQTDERRGGKRRGGKLLEGDVTSESEDDRSLLDVCSTLYFEYLCSIMLING